MTLDVLFGLLALAGLGLQPLVRRHRLARACRSTARALGASVDYSWPTQINGEIEGFRFIAVPEDLTERNPRARIHVIGPFSHLAFRLAAESSRSVLGLVLPPLREQDVLLGDAEFDSTVLVQGREAEVLAALNSAARSHALRLIRDGVELQIEGRRLSGTRRATLRAATLVPLLHALVDLAKAIAGEESVPERLARNALMDPVAGVRLRNLQALVAEFGATSQARDACRSAIKDRSPWVRLQAARGLGPDGLDALADLATRSALNEQVAREALEDLLTLADRARATSVCVEVLASGRGEAKRRAIEVLGRLRHRPALEGIARALLAPEAAVAEAAARALGLIGGPEAETALLGAVGETAGSVQVAAVRALGEMGTVRAVPDLRALLQEGGTSPTLRWTAQEAVSRIQSRLVGAEAGQLALADLDHRRGAVSLVEIEAESGRVSLADSARGPRP